MYNSIATKLSNAVAPPKLDAHLSCSLPNGLLTTIPLQNGTTYVGNHNGFHLEQFRDKAKAIIRRARKRYYLQVLEADTQTYVNRQLVKDACSLKHGDLIQIGDLFAVYYTEPTVTA